MKAPQHERTCPNETHRALLDLLLLRDGGIAKPTPFGLYADSRRSARRNRDGQGAATHYVDGDGASSGGGPGRESRHYSKHLVTTQGDDDAAQGSNAVWCSGTLAPT